MSVGVRKFRLLRKDFFGYRRKAVSAQGHEKTGVIRTVNPLA